ncbi:MAG: RDD family protein [Candidatus Tumulicola sp.]
MERSVTVRTPESIAFHYELAGLGSRFLAVAVDLIVQIILAIGAIIITGYTLQGINRFLSSLHLKSSQADAVITAGAIVLYFIIFFGYFIAFEALWNGQTPGKRAIGIRVVRDGGYPIGFTESVIRNLIRVIEVALFAYGVSAICAIVSAYNKRLGDLAAGTIVVRDSAFEVSNPARWLEGDLDPSPSIGVAGAAALTDEELSVVRRYLERRSQLEPEVARQLAQRVAASIRPKLGPDSADLDDNELLRRVGASRRR